MTFEVGDLVEHVAVERVISRGYDWGELSVGMVTKIAHRRGPEGYTCRITVLWPASDTYYDYYPFELIKLEK